MENNNDKSDTIKFEPIRDENYGKEKQERNKSDIYSEARKSYSEEDYNYENSEEENSDKRLQYTAIGLVIFLIIVITAGFFIIGRGGLFNRTKNEDPEKTDIILYEEEKEEDAEVSEKDEIKKYDVVFYGDSVSDKGNYYEIKADLYDSSFKRVATRKIIVNSSTIIKEKGKRITPQGLSYIVENLAGEMIIFEGEIRNDGFAVSLSFDGDFKEQTKEDEDKNSEIENNDSSQNEENEKSSENEDQEGEKSEEDLSNVKETESIEKNNVNED